MINMNDKLIKICDQKKKILRRRERVNKIDVRLDKTNICSTNQEQIKCF